ncbi:hypothetical protein [Enhygromyxa salina]|uniref:Uncharacterized protein n=1 Tax=Enhygromyxa salina TaxID=215803 RepID=A0A2S9YVT9_9BACT|nr:hypothetical protein [Enhygromyxa salina]PRQ09200.1 hypothetical protein ENSA7_11900 [Enhygromyxa salina]
MDEDERIKAPELQGRAAVLAISLVIIALAGGTAWGWYYAGPLGGLLGVLLGTAIGALLFTIVRAIASGQQFDEPPAPDVRELPPDQAMQVLTALMAASASGSYARLELEGGLLAEIAKAKNRAKTGDLDGAMAQLRALQEEHPRSPAVPLEITRVLAGHEAHDEERQRAVVTTISLAIRGGMNRLAAELYEKLDQDRRDKLEFDDVIWERLARVFAARDDSENAAACRARVQSTEPLPDDSMVGEI